MNLKELDISTFTHMTVHFATRFCKKGKFSRKVTRKKMTNQNLLSKDDDFPPKQILNIPLKMARKWGGSLP